MQELVSRRAFLRTASALMGTALVPSAPTRYPHNYEPESKPDYSLTIKKSVVEISPKHIISTTTYNGEFPGPLLRLNGGQRVTIDVLNETDTPEQLHWHGQFMPSEVDGAAEEGTPFIPPRSRCTVSFLPGPSGFRFYHTHVRAGTDLDVGQYSGLVGPLYIEPRVNSGRYDREVFLTMKEFQPSFSRGGDMNMDFLRPASTVAALKQRGEGAMKASLAAGKPHGYEVKYDFFTINGKMLGHGEPVRVKQGEHVLFHVLNGSATEIRSLALPGHTFTVVAMDGNRLPTPVRVPGLWLGTAERISAIVEMDHPGVWVMGDMSDDDRKHGMGIVVEYAGRAGIPTWIPPKPHMWNYASMGKPTAPTRAPDEVFDMTFTKQNAALDGFNQWSINGISYPRDQMMSKPQFSLRKGGMYRLRMRNESDDIHPIHLHRHSFELTKVAGQKTSGVMKDVVMVGGYQELEIDFVADNPGMTLFHCHQQLHMDFGFMALFEYI
jgi:FtsP/CotA-like multicopper oxidase with cupredoxin domain